MSARGKRKREERARPESAERPDDREPEEEKEDDIEILEVVGVDETTGGPRDRPRPKVSEPADSAPATDHRPALQEALLEKERYHDLLLRKQAELDNFRKRAEKESQELRAAASAELVRRLLPVVDNLERALRANEGQDDALRRGVDLIHHQLIDTLAKEGLAPIDTVGTPFDPHRHEAVEVQDVPGLQAGMVLEELQKGYTLNGKLLRPALVKVASGRAPEAGALHGPDGAASIRGATGGKER